MNQVLMKKTRAGASLRRPKPARSVLLRMAADESRAKRLRDLKAEFPDVTWSQLARYCGVSDRSVAQWAATGAMSYPNAKKAAQFFQERGADIDDDFVWRGLREDIPNLMDVLGSNPPQPNVIEELLRGILSRLDALAPLGDRLAELERDLGLLKGQLAASDVEATARHEEVLRAIRRQPPGEQQQ